MNDFEALLDSFWITRAENKELYFSVKRALPQYRKLITEQLGWSVIVNESLIKLEKVPPKAMAWMGISEFQQPLDYCLLCAMLLYLSDHEDGYQFLLSTMTEALETILADVNPVDWTRFTHRKSLVRVLKYAQKVGLLLVYDGNTEGFGNDQNQEVLYEHTGASRYFTVHFGRDISQCRTIQDFESLFGGGQNTERGRLRTQGVYRQLVLSPGVYWSSQNTSDYDYIKNQRTNIQETLGQAMSGELQVHKNGAFFVLDEDGHFGELYPNDKGESNAALCLCALLREKIKSETYSRRADDTVFLSDQEFNREVSQCLAQYGPYWGKNLRSLGEDKLAETMIIFMERWMLLKKEPNGVLLYPAVGKWIGHYPANLVTEQESEEEHDESLENA
jgi:uncharacterized protein (TIGR02678 family)